MAYEAIFFKDFSILISIFGSDGPFVQLSGTILAVLEKGIKEIFM